MQNNPRNQTESPNTDTSTWVQAYKLAAVVTLVMIVSTILNFFALIHVLRRNKRKLKFIHVIMASLFVANFIQAPLGYPQTIISMTVTGSKILDNYSLCQFTAYVVFSTSVVSIEHVVILSLHRYFQFSRPNLARIINRKWKTALSVAIIAWILGLLQTSFPLFGWGKFGRYGHICSIDCINSSMKDYIYLIYAVIMFYILPVVTLISTRQMISKKYASSFGRWPMKFQQRYMNMEAIMLISFIVCWTPYSIVVLCQMFSVHISVQTAQTCSVFAKVSTVVNSLVYCLVYNVWRKSDVERRSFSKRRTQSIRNIGNAYIDYIDEKSVRCTYQQHGAIRHDTVVQMYGSY